MTALTNTAIDRLEVGGRLTDDQVRGLEVRRTNSGTSFLLYYRTKSGTPRRPKIGSYPDVPLRHAREIARQMLIKVAAGEDPVDDRRKERGEPTMAILWERCKREHWNRGTAWDGQAKRLYDAHIGPKLGGTKVSQVSYDDVSQLHAKLKDTPYEANRMLAVLSKMLKFAEPWGYRPMGSNPCQHVARYPERKRKRHAKPAELGALGPIMAREAEQHPEAVAFLYCLAFSGARPSEIVKAPPAGAIERVQLGGETFGVLRLHGKTSDDTGEDRTVFLPPQAMRVIDRLPAEGLPCGDAMTLTGLAGVPRKVWYRIRREAGCTDLWARDWRRSFASAGLSFGLVTKDQIGELLGHASVQTTSIYAKLHEDPGMQAAAAIAGRMEQLLGGRK